MITFARETWDQYIADAEPMLPDHWAELAMWREEIPLDPDYDRYKRICDAGTIRVYVAREDGVMIGYALFALMERHLHYNHRYAVNDIIWIRPDHRNAGVGDGLLDFCEADLMEGGPIVILIETKTAAPELAGLLIRRRYEIVGPVLGKRL